MKKYLISLSIITLLLAACGQSTVTSPTATSGTETTVDEEIVTIDTVTNPTETTTDSTDANTDQSSTTEITVYTTEEVAAHNNESDCWMILDGKVYDVTNYANEHPGGGSMLRGCGMDATQMFSQHSNNAWKLLDQFYIGDVVQ